LAQSVEEITLDKGDEALVVSEDIEPPKEEITVELGDIEEELPIGDEDLVIEMENDSEAAVEDEPFDNGVVTEPFDQAVTIDGATFMVTAAAGAFPAGPVLGVTKVIDAEMLISPRPWKRSSVERASIPIVRTVWRWWTAQTMSSCPIPSRVSLWCAWRD